MSKEIDFSIIVPVYFNEGTLKETYRRIKENVFKNNPSLTGEVVFVDDGSGDNSLTELLEIQSSDPQHVTVIKLSRNFGQNSARLAGYTHARGKCFIHLTADLQDPVEVINDMLDAYFNQGYEIVIAERLERDESSYRKITSLAFYWLIQKLCFSNMPLGGFDYHLIGSKVRQSILETNEANAFFQGQMLWSGFTPKFLQYSRMKRTIGKSRWTFSKKIKLMIDGLLGYSFFPIRMITVLGFIFAFISLILALFLVYRHFMEQSDIQGWTSIVTLILLVAGLQMMMLGVLGEYIWRILDQSRNRKQFVIDRIYDSTNSKEPTTTKNPQ